MVGIKPTVFIVWATTFMQQDVSSVNGICVASRVLRLRALGCHYLLSMPKHSNTNFAFPSATTTGSAGLTAVAAAEATSHNDTSSLTTLRLGSTVRTEVYVIWDVLVTTFALGHSKSLSRCRCCLAMRLSSAGHTTGNGVDLRAERRRG